MPLFTLPRLLGLASAVALVGGGVGIVAVSAVNAGEECAPPLSSGTTSNLVSVSGEGNGVPEVSFPTPLVTDGRQLTVLTEGSGQPAQAGGFVDFDVSVFVGSDEAFLTASSYQEGNPVRRPVAGIVPEFFGEVLECQKPGATVVVTSTVGDVFGPIGEDDYLQLDSTIAVVVDVRDTYPGSATGNARLPQSGLPTLSQAPSGHHGLTFPNAPIPEELRVSVLKQGEGETIAEGGFVTAHLTGFVWETRSVFISSFDQGVPLSLVATDLTSAADGVGVIPGLATALVGLPVGSQVLVSIPPSLGYPEGSTPPGVPSEATLVYVLDILGVNN